MSESFLLCFRPASKQFDYEKIDQVLGERFPNLKRLEPGAWHLRTDDVRWARNVLERLSNDLKNLAVDGAIMVRSIGDPRDFAVHPHKANEYTEFCNLQALVQKHRLHAD